MVASPPRDAAGKRFYAEHDRIVARAVDLKAMGFEWIALNATAIFQAGARSVDAMIDVLGALHTKIRGEVGKYARAERLERSYGRRGYIQRRAAAIPARGPRVAGGRRGGA